ncbi:unnamed protein product [Adineta steineri]|uniref:Uncharacterized protein n=1 Tax=Adineta steineri TaxID=433720 RepID=A0A814U5G4_9BILA|nr:unnamed protein product [Adineta steineri]CAF3973751.1 unnamed protein product [Adineta steineri]
MKFHAVYVVVGIIACPFIFFCIFAPSQLLQVQVIELANGFKYIEKSNFSNEWKQTIHKYLTFPLDNHYGSHSIVLLAAAYASETGAILELGMGSSSTPLLHRLAVDQNRFLLSADSDIRWVNYFVSGLQKTELHQMKYVEVKTEMGVEWAAANLSDAAKWSIVFIDHRPGPRREFDLRAYALRSTLVLLHDTEVASMYKYHNALPLYTYQYRFTRLKTYTDVLIIFILI